MSVNFWVKLVSALSLFGIAIIAVQLYKSELIRAVRARFLRRKIVPIVQTMLPMINEHAHDISGAEPNYHWMRCRADLEALFKQAHPLFDEERDTIEKFLVSLSALSFRFDRADSLNEGVENSVLLGQRVVQELTEIGL